jgi:hypothetical protein
MAKTKVRFAEWKHKTWKLHKLSKSVTWLCAASLVLLTTCGCLISLNLLVFSVGMRNSTSFSIKSQQSETSLTYFHLEWQQRQITERKKKAFVPGTTRAAKAPPKTRQAGSSSKKKASASSATKKAAKPKKSKAAAAAEEDEQFARGEVNVLGLLPGEEPLDEAPANLPDDLVRVMCTYHWMLLVRVSVACYMRRQSP